MKKSSVGCWLLAVGAVAAFAAEPGPLLVPDYNRDGKIDLVDYDRLATGEVFTVWLNDDDDAEGAGAGEGKGDTNIALHDVPDGNDKKDCEDDAVNGRCDLLDFFPVLIDVNVMEEGTSYKWKLISKSVNVVFTKLEADTAGDFHTGSGADEAYGPGLNQYAYDATVSRLVDEEAEFPEGFLHKGQGIILIEGTALGDEGLTLRGEKDGSAPVVVTLKLSVKNVEKMYGWMNLRPKSNVRLLPTTSTTSSTDIRHFIFVHGYNTNHEEARGNAAEFYKKLWQSGSDAMFTAVEWRGDQSQMYYDLLYANFSPNYFANVANAFAAASSFKDACAKLPGEKILVGYSLGNVLISSAIKDCGLDYTKYVMLDAEVAGKDFEAGGRFANLPRTINYYSPSDPFFAKSEINVETCEPSELAAALLQGSGFWSLNAKIKKSMAAVDMVNEYITNFLGQAETNVITSEQLGYAGVIESPAAGADPVATLKNVNMEDFIGENPDWPVYEEVAGQGEERKEAWHHSSFREVAFYHTSRFYASLAAVGKPRVIIDTDLGSSMDDLFTVDLAARMHREGKLDLMAVMMDRPDRSDQDGNGEFLTFADRYLASLGLGDLPIGTSMELKEPQGVFNPYWTLIYSNSVTGVGLLLPTNRTPEQVAFLTNAVALYRRLLEDAQPRSVVICSTGFLNNLKALMESEPNHGGDDIASTGLELIAAKVKELRIMGGCFDSNSAPVETDGVEYNFAGDPEAAKKVVEEWPTPVVVSPWEVGLKLAYQPDDVLADFPTGTFDPVVRAAYTYWPEPEGEAMNRMWDPMTVLPLIDGDTLVPLSAKGGIEVDEKGVTTFAPNASSNRCYQVASEMDADAVMNRFREIFQSDDVPLAIGERIVCVTAEDASNTMKRAEFTPSKEVENKLGKWSQALETYCDMFEFDVVPTSGEQWAVEAYLKLPDWTNVVESAQEATRQLPLADIAAWQSGEDPIPVPLTNCVPGFYYSLFDGVAVTKLKADSRNANCNVLCGAEKTVCLPEVTPPPGGTTSGFFTIGVLEVPSVIPGETETSTNLSAIKRPERGGKSDIL